MPCDTGQRTINRSRPSGYRGSDGQHYDRGSGAPGEARGQTGRIYPGVDVGNQSGGEQQMSVPAPAKNADISTEK